MPVSGCGRHHLLLGQLSMRAVRRPLRVSAISLTPLSTAHGCAPCACGQRPSANQRKNRTVFVEPYTIDIVGVGWAILQLSGPVWRAMLGPIRQHGECRRAPAPDGVPLAVSKWPAFRLRRYAISAPMHPGINAQNVVCALVITAPLRLTATAHLRACNSCRQAAPIALSRWFQIRHCCAWCQTSPTLLPCLRRYAIEALVRRETSSA